jgi:hypothetical protein
VSAGGASVSGLGGGVSSPASARHGPAGGAGGAGRRAGARERTPRITPGTRVRLPAGQGLAAGRRPVLHGLTLRQSVPGARRCWRPDAVVGRCGDQFAPGSPLSPRAAAARGAAAVGQRPRGGRPSNVRRARRRRRPPAGQSACPVESPTASPGASIWENCDSEEEEEEGIFGGMTVPARMTVG